MRFSANNLLILKIIFETSWENAQPVFACFVDLEKAYSRVPRDKLWDVLGTYGIDERLLAAVKSLCRDCRSCVRIKGGYVFGVLQRIVEK